VESLFEGSASIEGKVAWAERYGLDSFGKVGTELDPFRGESNPVSLPSRCWIEDDKAFATYRAHWAYEGPPGRMHGGYVAAIFDNFLGMAQVMDGKPGMTGTLKVNYHRATPLNTELSLEAEIVKAEGRTKVLRGVMMANGERTATCEGLFIQPKNGFHAQTSPEA
jgi:acyl-coenzyme A thioesterase PaaI-like protein